MLLIVATLLAALGTALIWLYVQGADSRARDANQLYPAYFIGVDAPAGTPVSELQITRRLVSADVSRSAVGNLDEVTGKRLADRAVAGQLMLSKMFTTGPGTGLPPKRAFVALSVPDARRVPALLRPGQEVAVYSLPLDRGRARLVVPRARVISVGSSLPDQQATRTPGRTGTGTGAGQPVPVTVIGFDVTPGEALAILELEQTGQPGLVLLGPGTEPVRPSKEATP